MLNELVSLSNRAGIRTDWIQAGGGNTSVKSSQEMWIKASGVHLADVSESQGIAKVDLTGLLKFLNTLSDDLFTVPTQRPEREKIAKEALLSNTLNGSLRPSIETFLHVLLHRVTLHTHPLLANMILQHPDWDQILGSIFENAVFVPYATPGLDLAWELKKALDKQKTDSDQTVVFLQNHGVITSAKNVTTTIQMALEIDHKIVESFPYILNVQPCSSVFPANNYFRTEKIRTELGADLNLNAPLYCSSDITILNTLFHNPEILFHPPFCPDVFVFCGATPLWLESNWRKEIKDWKDKYQQEPKVIYCDGLVYFSGANLKKAKEAEELMRFHCLSVAGALKLCEAFPPKKKNLNLSLNTYQELNVLAPTEIAWLGNWESEKYRQNIGGN